jgi:hypothetical protein
VTPRDAPARLGVIPVGGPWLIGTYESCGIQDSDLQCAITDRIFDRLTQTLVSLETRLPNFRVVDTTGTLGRASPTSTGSSRDWLNEIHPNKGGYKKLAARIAGAL